MSESLEGVSVAATRQNAGTFENCEAAEAGPPGMGSLKEPAATVFADVIVVSGNLNEARLSHEAAKTGDAVRQNIANVVNMRIFLAATSPPSLISAAVQPRTKTRNDSVAAPARRLFRNRDCQKCPRPWRREPVDAAGL